MINERAIKFTIGSTKNTALTLFSNNKGSIYISGISKISFLRSAKKIDVLAFPLEINACWQLIYIPNTKDTAINILIEGIVKFTKFILLVKAPINT